LLRLSFYSSCLKTALSLVLSLVYTQGKCLQYNYITTSNEIKLQFFCREYRKYIIFLQIFLLFLTYVFNSMVTLGKVRYKDIYFLNFIQIANTVQHNSWLCPKTFKKLTSQLFF